MMGGARAVLLCIALLGCVLLKDAAAQAPTPPPASSALPFVLGDARAVVLYFIASDCPVSNRLLPEMLRIENKFAADHVRFFFVYPNTTETPATVRAHGIAYGLNREQDILTDTHGNLARLSGANVTPEAAILVPRGTTLKAVYTGRIDDRFLSLGTERPSATRHDLEDALAAVVTNHRVLPPGGPPVGCAFMTLQAK